MPDADAEVGGIVGEFLSLKAETDADYLVMQVGDFYEFYSHSSDTCSES